GALKTVNVRGNAGPLNIAGSTPTYYVVNAGDAGSAQGVRGAVTITGWPNDTQLNVDDSADPVARNVTISAGAITGLAPAAINYQTDAINLMNVWGGTGANTYAVAGTPSNPYWDVLTTLYPGGAAFGTVEVVNVRATTGPLSVVGDTPAY